MARSPSISVIITNHNYSNYLAAAIESVLHQTSPAIEIIVVDDGSTDGSTDILETYSDRVTVIRKACGGQASAFNAGFAAARGDLIYFLDADDAAGPDLIETVAAVWHESLAAVCFAVELLDQDGRHMGVYDVLPSDIDNRPGLVGTGGFTFLPTSANVFARRVLEQLMPMDEPRWRISADAVLLRAATIAGRVMPLRRTLGAYRIHAHNNYYVQGASDLWRERRDMRDITDLADAFAASPRYFGLQKGLSADERRRRNADAIALMTGGLRFRTFRAEMFDPDHGTGPALRRLARRLLQSDLPWGSRLALAAASAAASVPAQHSARLRLWIGDPGTRPAPLAGLLRLCGHDALARAKASARRARWRAPQEVGKTYDLTSANDGFPMLQDGWRVTPQPGLIYMRSNRATLSLWMNPSPDALTVQLVVSPLFGSAETVRDLSILVNNEVLAHVEVAEPMAVDIPLKAGSVHAGGEIVLDLRLARGASGSIRSRVADRLSTRPTIALSSVTVLPAVAMPRSAYAEDGVVRPFADFLAGKRGKGFILSASGGGILNEPSGEAQLSVLQAATPIELILERPAGQPSGLMRITCEGQDLFQGQWDGAGDLHLDLPVVDTTGYALLELRFDFTPDDLADPRRPTIATGRFHRRRTRIVSTHQGRKTEAPRVNPGQHLQFDEGSAGTSALGNGWHFDDEGIPVASDGMAEIQLRLPGDTPPLSATIHFAPILEPVDGLHHVLSVSCRDLPLCQVAIEGPAEITVPLDAVSVAPDGKATLTVHSLLVAEDGPAPRPGPIRLEGMTFSAAAAGARHATTQHALRLDMRERAGALEARLREADDFLNAAGRQPPDTGFDDAALDTLRAHRAGIAAAVRRLGARALASALVTSQTLERITRLAAAVEDALPAETATGAQFDTWPDNPDDALRQAVCALVEAPAWTTPAFADLAKLPPALLWHVPALADALTRVPPLLPHPAQRFAYTAFVERLVSSADDLLGRMLPGSVHHTLAGAVIHRIRPRHALFASDPTALLLAKLGRAMERLLHLDGYPLGWLPPARREQNRLRLGIVLRTWGDEPEVRIVRGLFSAIDPRLQLVRILLDPGSDALDADGFEETINLAGLDAGEAVQRIRAAQLDVLLLGAYFIGMERLTAIVAHRLAPLQLATAAISPTTTGLSSFDGMITNEDLDPAHLLADYAEETLRFYGPIQRFAPRLAPRSARLSVPSRTQSRLLAGLPLDATLFVSGAMAQKIGTDLLDAFARILEQVPDAVLALYPFAANWRTTFAPAAFRRLVNDALSARGVSPDRVFVMPALSGNEVTALLGAADVYLDSFPYAGATTVIEALEQQCPVVALEGETQRGRQGAVWLRQAGLADNAMPTVEAYVARAVLLGRDSDIRGEVRARIAHYLDAGPVHRGDALFSHQFADRLIDLAKARGVHLADAKPEGPVVGFVDAGLSDEPHRYVYHHMPKTAGTAAKTVFRSRFRLRQDYREKWSPVHGREPFNLDEITPDDLICSHFELPESRIERRYPEFFSEAGWRVFTFVREPLDLALSNYFFERDRRRGDPAFTDVGLSAHLRGEKDNYLEHFDHQDGDWRSRLDRYWFIGTVERLDECLAFLGRTWGCILPPITIENATPRPETPDPADVEVFLRNHETAYAMYNTVRRRLDETLKR